MKLFNQSPINTFFSQILNEVKPSIFRVSEQKLNSEEPATIAAQIAQTFNITPLSIDFESRTLKVIMKDVRVMDVFAPRNIGTASQAYVKYSFVVTSGDMRLLSLMPTTRSFQRDVDYEAGGNNFSFGYQTKYSNEYLTEDIKDEVKKNIKPITEELPEMQNAVNKDIETFNTSLQPHIEDLLNIRKDELIKKKKRDHDLNNF